MLNPHGEDDFFVTLLSSSSLNYYPDNTIGKFRNHLPYPVSLTGNYEVALTEISYNHSFHNIYAPKCNYVIISYPGTPRKNFELELEEATYDASELVATLNSLVNKEYKFTFKLQPRKMLSITCPRKSESSVSLTIPPVLHAKLGFLPEERRTFKPGDSLTFSNLPCNPAYGSSQLFIYCDLVQPRIFGSTLVHLLKIVPANSEIGKDVTVTFEQPQYVKCYPRPLVEDIKISINRLDGSNVVFDAGIVIVTLHFRRC